MKLLEAFSFFLQFFPSKSDRWQIAGEVMASARQSEEKFVKQLKAEEFSGGPHGFSAVICSFPGVQGPLFLVFIEILDV